MKDLVDYLMKFNRRLISPIGGTTKKKFSEYIDTSNMTAQDISAYSMKFQCEEIGHDLQFTCIDDIRLCKCFELETYTISNGNEYVTEGQITNYRDLLKLKEASPLNHEIVYNSIAPIKKFKTISDKLIGGGCFGPLTTAGAMVGVSEISKSVITNPDFVESILEIMTDFMINMAKQCENSGADFFWIAEPLSVLLSPRHFQKFSGKYIKKIFDSISIPGFLHVCGNTTAHTAELLKTGVKCLSLDYLVDMRDIAHRVPPNVVLMGNIDPVYMLQAETYEVENAVKKLNIDMRNFSNFVMSSGCLIPPNTPTDNVEALFKITNEFPIKTRQEYNEINELWHIIIEENFEEMIKWIKNNKTSNEIVLSGFEEACTYLGRQFKYKKLDLVGFSNKLYELEKLLASDYINLEKEIYIEHEKYELSYLKKNFTQLMMKNYTIKTSL